MKNSVSKNTNLQFDQYNESEEGTDQSQYNESEEGTDQREQTEVHQSDDGTTCKMSNQVTILVKF